MPTPCQAWCPSHKVIRTHGLWGFGRRISYMTGKREAWVNHIGDLGWIYQHFKSSLILSFLSHTKSNPLVNPWFFLPSNVGPIWHLHTMFLEVTPRPFYLFLTYDRKQSTEIPESNMAAQESYFFFKQLQPYFKCKLSHVIYLLKTIQWIPITLRIKPKIYYSIFCLWSNMEQSIPRNSDSI